MSWGFCNMAVEIRHTDRSHLIKSTSTLKAQLWNSSLKHGGIPREKRVGKGEGNIALLNVCILCIKVSGYNE